MQNTTVLISGASIAGPSLAYWLSRYGFRVTVVERAPALRPGGQAVDVKGRVHLTVLERMGVLDEVRRRQTGGTDMVFVDANGRQRAQLSGDFTGGDVEILRGDLAEILYQRTCDECEYLFGDSIRALRDTGDAVTVEFEHAPPRQFDLVLGADGTHSRVRSLVFGPERDFTRHRGYYYAIAESQPTTNRTEPPSRDTAYALAAPGKLAVLHEGSEAQQMYLFAARQLDYDRDDTIAQRRLLIDTFTGLGWRVPDMLTELEHAESFYLDALTQVRMRSYISGRVALVGDAGYGNTLAGFGTGMALVGAYVLAGELAVADGEHNVAFEQYDTIMRGYSKIAGTSSPGRFLAPKTAYGLWLRNWFFRSRWFDLMQRYGNNASEDIDLRDYPELVEQ